MFENIERNYIKNIFSLLSGSVAVQVIQLIGTFVLTYFFEKAAFGALSFLLSVSFVFEMVAGLQYNNAALVAADKKNLAKLMIISVLSALLVSGLLLVGILLVQTFVPQFFDPTLFQGALIILPVLVVSNFVFSNFILVLKYLGKVRNINIFRACYVVFTLASKLIAASLFATIESLIYAHVLGVILTSGLIVYCYRKPIWAGISKLRMADSLQLLKENHRFPKFSIVSNVVNAASNISFPILITLFFGLHENGVYYLTTVFIFQPLLLILQAVGDAFIQRANLLFYENTAALFRFIRQQQAVILKILLLYFIVILVSGELLFQYFLPDKWIEIGKFIKYQLLFFLFASLYAPFSIIGDLMKQQRFLMLFNLSLFLSQLLVLFFLHKRFDFTFVIFVAAIASCIHYGFINFYMLRKLKFHHEEFH